MFYLIFSHKTLYIPSTSFYLLLKIVSHNFSLVYVVFTFKEKSIFFINRSCLSVFVSIYTHVNVCGQGISFFSNSNNL